MKNYRIIIYGCDDLTVFEMELTDGEAALVRRIGEQSKRISTYVCMPTLEIEPIDTEDVK